jgi:hypothetical protein
MDDEAEMLRKYNNIYLTIITRYKDYIEEHEVLHLTELPKLITPLNKNVASIAEQIRSGFESYNPSTDFYSAAYKALESIKSIKQITMPIQFWQMPSETISNGAGDEFDRAVVLCSVLIALGNPSTKVAVVTAGEQRNISVYFSNGDKVACMDVSGSMREFASSKELFDYMGAEGEDSSAYEFNDKMYSDIY